MIDVKHQLRKAYFELLNGVLTYNGSNVPVGDDTVDFDVDLYVILASQDGTPNGTFQTFDSIETIDLDIVFKAGTFANKNVVDNIAGQILNLLLPVPGGNGLPGQFGIQINCLSVTGDRYLGFAFDTSDSVVRRILTITQKVRQTSDSDSPAIGPDGYFLQVNNETPTGTIDGANKDFFTEFDFVASSVVVTLNGLRQVPGLHFAMTLPNKITFSDAPQVDPGNGPDNILIDYIKKS